MVLLISLIDNGKVLWMGKVCGDIKLTLYEAVLWHTYFIER